MVKEFIKGEGSLLKIKLVLLPPYSPELNPDEQVWNQAKRQLGKMSLNSKRELKDAVTKVLTAIQASVSLIKSFFRLPDTLYACNSY